MWEQDDGVSREPASGSSGRGSRHSRELDSQPTAAGHAYRTVGPSATHGVVRANKLILSLLAFFCFSLRFILANEVI